MSKKHETPRQFSMKFNGLYEAPLVTALNDGKLNSNNEEIIVMETEPVLKMLETMAEALKESGYFVADQTARVNEAIAQDCPQCDYQCQGCIHSLDDCDTLRPKVTKALDAYKSFIASLGDK